MCVAEAQTWDRQCRVRLVEALCPCDGDMLGTLSLLQSMRSLPLQTLQHDLPVLEDWRVCKKELSTKCLFELFCLSTVMNAPKPLTHHKCLLHALRSGFRATAMTHTLWGIHFLGIYLDWQSYEWTWMLTVCDKLVLLVTCSAKRNYKATCFFYILNILNKWLFIMFHSILPLFFMFCVPKQAFLVTGQHFNRKCSSTVHMIATLSLWHAI